MYVSLGSSWTGSALGSVRQTTRARAHARAGVVCAQAEDPFLKVEGLKAEIANTGEGVLKGVNLTVNYGEVPAVV